MNFVVVLEPSRQQSDYGLSIWQDRQPSIIALEGFDECLRDAVGFWRADWRETRLEAQGRCGVERVLGDVRRAVVGQPFDGMRRLADPEIDARRKLPSGRVPSRRVMPAEGRDRPELTLRSGRRDAHRVRSVSLAIETAKALPPGLCPRRPPLARPRSSAGADDLDARGRSPMCRQRTRPSLGGEAGGRSLGFISASFRPQANVRCLSPAAEAR